MMRRALAAMALALGVIGLAAPAAATSHEIARIELSGVIDQVNAAYVEEALRVAAADGAEAALIVIDSPGGELRSMDRIIQAILGSDVPVIAWVAPEGARAGSAATFVTLAADVAAMAPNTNIGAASVVGSGGEDLPDTLAAKVTNDAVARIRSLADEHGRNADWAEDAVREAASVGAAEAVAMEPPVADILAGDLDALLAAIDAGARPGDGRPFEFEGEPLPALSGATVRELEMNPGQQFLHLLSDPNIAFLLFTIGFYGIIAELFHPNFFSGIIGAIAIVVALIGSNALPLNVGGLLLVLIGVGLLALEAVVTSYGLLTVGGVVSLVLGAFALWTGVEPGDLAVDVSVSPWIIAVVVAVGVLYAWILVRALVQMRRTGGVANPPVRSLVGGMATAQTFIGPTGIAYAGGESWSARARDAEIRAGTPLRIVDVEGLELIVEPAPAGTEGSTEEGPWTRSG